MTSKSIFLMKGIEQTYRDECLWMCSLKIWEFWTKFIGSHYDQFRIHSGAISLLCLFNLEIEDFRQDLIILSFNLISVRLFIQPAIVLFDKSQMFLLRKIELNLIALSVNLLFYTHLYSSPDSVLLLTGTKITGLSRPYLNIFLYQVLKHLAKSF